MRLSIDVPVTVQPLVNGTLSVPFTGAGVDPRRSFAWQVDNPRVGAPGLQYFATHTYIGSVAIGNLLGKSGGAKKGDIIKVYGASGQVACYQVSDVLLYDVASVPSSLLNAQPAHSEMLIEFCWSYNSSTKIWEQRKYVRARLM